jgi:hypothetical protein
MKISFDIDCTPEEARRFLGFPDLSSVHEAFLEKMRGAVSEGFTSEAMGDMMKTWGPFSEAGVGLWKQMMEQMAGGGGSGKK